MKSHRLLRLNSLLKEVISEVIFNDLKNPHLPRFVTITSVDITKDLRNATVLFSVIGKPEDEKKALEVLQQASKFIAVQSSKKVVLRYFPELRFKLDESSKHHMRIDAILKNLNLEQSQDHDTSL